MGFVFQHPLCRKTAKKFEVGTLWGKNFFHKKVSQCRKKLKGGPFGLAQYGMLRGKTEKKLFWFSSLDQIVQFGAIIFCRIFKNYFGQFVWIEKKKSHYNSRVSLHEAPTKKEEKSLL